MRGAMQRAEALESELEAAKAQHGEALRTLGGQQADLEEFLGAVRASEAALGGQLAEAIDARRRFVREGERGGRGREISRWGGVWESHLIASSFPSPFPQGGGAVPLEHLCCRGAAGAAGCAVS